MAIRSRLGDFHRLGFEPPSPAINPVLENLTLFDAGPIRIGVERRVLPTGDNPDAFQGPTIHVYGAEDGHEYLRFDIFDGLPHYHYMDPDTEPTENQAVPGQSDVVVVYDFAANGPMWPWAIECLRSRIPAMLREAEIYDLADKVDNDAIAAVLPQIIELCEPIAPKEHRTTVAASRMSKETRAAIDAVTSRV